jgi:hypothetical protein
MCPLENPTILDVGVFFFYKIYILIFNVVLVCRLNYHVIFLQLGIKVVFILWVASNEVVDKYVEKNIK